MQTNQVAKEQKDVAVAESLRGYPVLYCTKKYLLRYRELSNNNQDNGQLLAWLYYVLIMPRYIDMLEGSLFLSGKPFYMLHTTSTIRNSVQKR